uniref:Adhesin domain-containing protein n=1 Tax=candidate division WOR-3 bacterium TaxID=2052148 RepID=A0A7C4Y647_UNCW3
MFFVIFLLNLDLFKGIDKMEFTAETTITFLNPQNKLLEVENMNGNILLEEWGKNIIKIEIEKKASDKELLNKMEVDVREEKDRISIRPKGKISNASFEFHIFLPGKVNLRLKNSNGNIKCYRLKGFIDALTENGNILLEGISGFILARSYNGNVAGSIEGLDDTISILETYNGNIVIIVPEDLKLSIYTKSINGITKNEIPVYKNEEALMSEKGKKISLLSHNGNVIIKKK